MKHHIMMALGILMAVIFAYRGANALLSPGFGLTELYILGGLVLAGALMVFGWQGFRASKKG
ncbi:MAG: hypothetical protein CMK07_07225 [Ponticaulis sp.]|nr:hypothetical protein [Ponticaulis sp.]